jgi:RNA polymerase sigma-70 factor (ECF subfamily)
MTTMTEAGLLACAQAGDERAFRQLVEPYRGALEAHCYRMLGSPHDAEDVVQEALLRAWRSLERFERRASLHTWLYRIATNVCLDELERRPQRPEPVQPFPDERVDAEMAAGVADPAARYALRESMELAFLTAIRRLPGRQRAVLILRDVLGWTAPEVADLLDSTVTSVNSALQRARATLDGALPATSRPPASAAADSQHELLRRYVDAWERADVDGLVNILHEDAVLRMPPQRAITGAAAIVSFFADHGCSAGMERITVRPAFANNRPAVVMHIINADGSLTPHGVLLLNTDDSAIATLEAYIDPRLPGLWLSGSSPG